MSFHPNDVVRRGRAAAIVVTGIVVFLASGFLRTQILEHEKYALQSETNRLREVPLLAPRGVIYDRKGQVIAENRVGYSVSLFGQSADSLRATLKRLSATVPLTPDEIEASVRRYRKDPTRPTVIIADASFDVVSVLEEHRIDFPGLIIQSSPKRFYPDSTVVATFVGYTSEINERELASANYVGYKQGQQIGKAGLEKQYESILRGREGSRFVEVDARNRIVREAGARPDLKPDSGHTLFTNIDMDLQRFTAKLFADSALIGGAVALDPKTGAVLALYSAPSWDPNRFIGGVSREYYRSLLEDERRPLYNKALQGRYPPGSTWKLATAVIGLETGAAKIDDRMPAPCTGGFQLGNRYFRCWDKRGHGALDMHGAIVKSCDVYFYQLGLKIGLTRLVAGGISLGFQSKSGIDVPEEARSIFPTDAFAYFNRRWGARGWSAGATTLNLSIGQGENSQTILNMARFYTALATDGSAVVPEIAVGKNPARRQVIKLPKDQLDEIRAALAGVVAAGGTAAASQVQGLVLAGKTGTAQSGVRGAHDGQDDELDHAWFVGFAPANDAKIVVAVMLEFGGHGSRAARFASRMMEFYLKAAPAQLLQTEG